ncbi:MAG: GTPase Era [Roseiflexaceae bacterium]|nr:GTPase Era [Chloroflexaceae bacterium]MCE2853292.1 GTPase Era [Chloroflexaceae bacterium]
MYVSYDNDAGTLYWYFVELNEGDAVEELECPVRLLCDSNGCVVGIQLDLHEETNPPALVPHAITHPQATWDAAHAVLTVAFAPFAQTIDLAEPAILDIDPLGRILGVDVADVDHATPGRYDALASVLISPDDPEDDVSELPPVEDTSIILPTVERAGIVAIVGRPNVGKSTLLNAIIGQKIAITSPKPQTTRSAIRGILTRPDAQIIFVDTPGIHRPRNRLGNFMVQQARNAVPDADVLCMVVDITHMPNELDERIAAMFRRSRSPKILVLNKTDRPNPHAAECLAAFQALAPWDMEVAISALKRDGLDTLINEIVNRLPLGPAFYAAEQVTDQNERAIAAELVRERVMHLIGDEIPYGVAVEVEEWEQRPRNCYMRMTIYVEKESQKAIIIGKGGSMLRRIGMEARPAIENLIGQPVYLDLWVKPRNNWRDDPSALRWLGYRNQ